MIVYLILLLSGCGGGSSSSSVNKNPTPLPSGGGSTTTVQAETANNTSASDTFSAQLNALPKASNVSKVDSRSLLYNGSTTKIYAHLMGWFGKSGHMDVGYRSDDPAQMHRQVEDMISRGIQGAILDWSGPNDTVVDAAAHLLRKEAEAHPGFEFAIVEDGGALSGAAKASGCDVTAQVLSDLSYINSQYASSSSYMRVNGRPVIFFFGVDGYYIDWNEVRANVANNPLLVFRGVDGLKRPISDGGFQWLDIKADSFQPASPNPFDPLLAAQSTFYKMSAPGRLAVGSVYARFSDSLAQWGIGRFVHSRCGQTWLDTFGEIGKNYSAANQLLALQMVTWNDYDEGTAIEMGIDNCVYVVPSVSGNTLSWEVRGGPEETIDHFTVFSSTDGQSLTKLKDVPAGTHTLDLTPYNLSPGIFTLYVKATGRPSIQNKLSPAVAYVSGDRPPNVNVAVSQSGPLAVSVSTARSNDADGAIASTKIDFGDGTIQAGPSANHTYVKAGVYDVTVTVVDKGGASAVAVERVSAKSNAPGVAIFTPEQFATVSWPPAMFAASANSGNPIKQMSVLMSGRQIYAIDQDTLNTALKIYSGNQRLQVQATDSAGVVSSADLNVSAEPGDLPPIPKIEVTPLPKVSPNTVLFCGANWTAPNRFVNAYRWAFSDGATASSTGVVHTFPSAGTFSVTQTVINQFGTQGSVTQNVTVGVAGAAPR
jgi:PKD repeat protein